MKRTLLLYESRYGFTKEAIEKISMILGPSKMCTVEEFKNEYKDFDFFVIASSVNYEKISEKIYEFVCENKKWLTHKSIAVICTCLSKERSKQYIKPLLDILGESVVFKKTILGKLTLDKLNKEDYLSMKKFSDMSGMPFENIDKSNTYEIVNCGLEIKRKRDFDLKKNKEDIRKYIDEFISDHNTCTLCTGFDKNVRSTAIEYTYIDDYMFFISEGGEKFANIIMNPGVSISIYNDFHSMDNLGGIQINGLASIIPKESEDYKEFMKRKKIKVEKLSVDMNLIKVKLENVEFIWSKLKSKGYEVKQYYKY